MTTAVFSLVNAVLLKPPAITAINEVLDVYLAPKLSETEPAQPVTVSFPIAALAADQELPLPEVKMSLNQNPVSLFRMELHHNIQTIPIKYLTQIAFGPHAAGHRLADRKLMMAKFSKASEGDAGAGGAKPMGGFGPMGPGAGPMGPMGPMGGMMPGRGAEGGGSETAMEFTINGVAKNRYIDVTDQVRRMPVAVVMIADQASLQDVLAAFINSPRLRFQTTQFHWKRAYLSGGGADTGAGDGEGERPSPKGGAGPMGPGMGPMGPGAGPMGPGFGPMGPGAPVGAAAFFDQAPMSLVEITIYGVANLYERPKEPLKTPASTGPVSPMVPVPVAPKQPGPETKPGDGVKPPEKPMDPKPSTPAKPTDPTPPMPPGPAKPSATGDKPVDPKAPVPPAPAKPAGTGEKPTDPKAPMPSPPGSKPEGAKPPTN